MLKEGSITLHASSGAEVNRKTGDYGALKGDALLSQLVQPDSLTAWTARKMVFDQNRMSVVARTITEYYVVKVILADTTVAAEPISAPCPSTTSTYS